MSYAVTKHLPIEKKLNQIITNLFEFGLPNFYQAYAMDQIQLSAALANYKMNQQFNNLTEADSHFLTFESMRVICIYYAFALAACTAVFVIESQWMRVSHAIALRLKSIRTKARKKNNRIFVRRRQYLEHMSTINESTPDRNEYSKVGRGSSE